MTQFVPLKVETRGESWSNWASKYSYEGKGIPIVYIVRADGEQLYGQTGNKRGNELPRFLIAHLQQSGRILASRELETLADAVDKAEAALESDDAQTACQQVRRIAKIGPLGNLGSFAKPALQADALVRKLTKQGIENLTRAEASLSDDAARLDGLVRLASVKRIYHLLPEVKKPLALSLRSIKKNRETRDLFAVAMKIDRVHVLLAKRKGGQKSAVDALQKIADRYPNTPASEYALAWAERLKSGDGSVPSVEAMAHGRTTEAIPEIANGADDASDFENNNVGAKPRRNKAVYRKWTTQSGKYSVDAKLIDVEGDTVHLRRRNGKALSVGMDRLSEADRRYIEAARR